MVQILEKSEWEEIVQEEESFVVIPEKKITFEKIDELRPNKKKSRLFRKHKKTIEVNKGTIDINKVKNKVNTNMLNINMYLLYGMR
ncbi:hypothetical protein LCGC14_0900040 [marine sediment metagenome]|uniref:Uncharacterized protein n=1 Tax=marine sediment metagenome TaxID=412755 RepID=A0A0F9RFT7_9ZZZZ